MRIAVIVTDFPKVTETFILRDLIEFNRQGHEVRVYHLTGFRSAEVVHDFAKPALGWAHYEAYILSFNTMAALIKALIFTPSSLFRIMAAICRAYRKEPEWLVKSMIILPKCLAIAADIKKWGADHVHAQFATHPATAAWISHRLNKIPYSVSCHAHDIFLTQSLLKEKLGEAAFVRTVSAFNKRFLEQKVAGLKGKRIEVIRVSVDSRAIEPFGQTTTEQFNILYVGSLEERKGINFLIDALHKFKDYNNNWRCHIIGGGPEDASLRQLVSRHGLDDKVVFLGPRSFEEITDMLKQTHVMVVPSIIGKCGRTEGLPTVIIEALAYQRPVIATNVTGIPELVVDGETGLLVEFGDSDAIYKALVKTHGDPDKAFAMAQNGRLRIEQEFDLHNNVATQLRLYQEYSS